MTDDKFICPKTDICLRQDQSAISCEHCKPHNWNLVCDNLGERYCPKCVRVNVVTVKDECLIESGLLWPAKPKPFHGPITAS